MTEQLKAAIAAYRTANAETTRLRDLKVTKEVELSAAREAHQKLSAGMGERILQATLAGKATQEKAIVAEVAQGATALQALEQLLTALDVRIAAAVQAERDAWADCFMAQAAAERIEADEIEAKVKPLLDQIEAIDGVIYAPRTVPAGVRNDIAIPTIAGRLDGRIGWLRHDADELEELTPYARRGGGFPGNLYDGKPLATIPNFLEDPE
mgnify:CR=1 FL=1